MMKVDWLYHYTRKVWSETTCVRNTDIIVIYIKVAFVKYAYCIKDVLMGHSDAEDTYIRDTNAGSTYLKAICGLTIYIKSAFVDSFSTIGHSKISL